MKTNILDTSISGHTNLLCLLGHPVEHSISPRMHTIAANHLGLDYAYLAFDITEEQLPTAVNALRLFGCRGWNLTMPLKRTIIPLLDELSEASALAGSVNTVVNNQGRLIGHTTDGIGFIRALEDRGCSVKGTKMTILGAGGVATPMIAQAAMDGVQEISVFKRKNATFAETEAFAKKITQQTSCRVTVYDMADDAALRREIGESQILANATNVGMGDDTTSLVDPSMFHSDLVVFDAIYHPAKTTLLRDAEAAGATIINGEGQLLFQGAASFALWTGKEMPINIIKETCFPNLIPNGGMNP